MKGRLITAVTAIVIAGLAAWALWPKPVSVETTVASRQDIVLTVSEVGKSRIREVFTLSAPVAGKMERINLHPGDALTADKSVVAVLRPSPPALLDPRARAIAEATADAARSAVLVAEAQLRQALSQMDFMQSELNRAAALLRRGNSYGPAYEKARLGFDTAKEAVESARAALAMRQKEKESAEAALGEGANGTAGCCVEITAPISGIVLEVMSESEQIVQPGTPILTIGDPSEVEIVTELLSQDAVRLAPGGGVTISGWGGPPLAGIVRRVDPVARTKISALGIEEQRVEVLIDLKQPARGKSGMGHGFHVDVEIEVWRGRDLLAVPVGALYRSGTEWGCFVVENGRARTRLLQIGARNDTVAEVQDGLSPGERVILHPSDRVSDGVLVYDEANP